MQKRPNPNIEKIIGQRLELQVCMGGAHPIVNSGPQSVLVVVGPSPICYPFPGAMILSLESGGEVSLQSFIQHQGARWWW